MNDPQIWDVIRPDDGARTQITCTRQQLETTWLPQGYVLSEGTAPTSAAVEEAAIGTSPALPPNAAKVYGKGVTISTPEPVAPPEEPKKSRRR